MLIIEHLAVGIPVKIQNKRLPNMKEERHPVHQDSRRSASSS
jgi:hypothetical protein